jgi:hydrogenase-4 component F
MAYVLILLPIVMAALAFATPSERRRPLLVPAGAALHLTVVMWAVFGEVVRVEGLGGWLLLDALGKLFAGFLAVLFFLFSLYVPGYLAGSDRPNRVFCTALFLTLAMTTLVALAHHLGLMWVAMEATTLVSAPTVYYYRNPRCLEATWKYLMVGSVGIALALFGTFFLAYAALKGGVESTLLFDDLIANAGQLSGPWVHGAFVLLFIGYGTKMGLAPMHTWKPDAYGEAPGLVGTLLAGGVTSTAFLALLRVYQICSAGSEAEFVRQVLIGAGLFSIGVAAVFMVRQRDFKRMLAYSSVEHMGILVLGIGIGGAAIYGALLHVLNNGLTKGVLFLSSGNIHRAYGSKVTDDVRGAMRRVPVSGALFLAGFLAITGSPPFGPFVSEFTIATAAFTSGQFVAAGLFLAALFVVFVGMGTTVLAVVQGEAPAEVKPGGIDERLSTVAPIALFMAMVLLLGLYIPPPLETLLHDAARLLEARR